MVYDVKMIKPKAINRKRWSLLFCSFAKLSDWCTNQKQIFFGSVQWTVAEKQREPL